MALPKSWFNPWLRIVSKYEKGEDIYKQEIIDALQSDYPVIYNAKPLLAGIVSGDFNFKKGTARNIKFSRPFYCLQLIKQLEYVESLIKNPDADLSGNDADAVECIESMRKEAHSELPGRRTARDLAKESVAKGHGISVRKLDGIIQELKDIH